MQTHPLRVGGITLPCFVLALPLPVAPAHAQVFRGELNGDDQELTAGRVGDIYSFHCEGGEAFRLSLGNNGFPAQIFVSPPEGELMESLDPRMTPEAGTFSDIIAKEPGEYTVYIMSAEAGGQHGPSASFDNGNGASFPVDFERLGLPLGVVTLGGGDGPVYWGCQRYVSQAEVEQTRQREPQQRIDSSFPEGGARQKSFDVELAEGQFFFAFVSADNVMDIEGAIDPNARRVG